MPIMINQPERDSKKPAEKKPQGRIQPVTAGGLLSDVRIVVAIAAGVILLVGGLFGWSQGWFGGAAVAPAGASSSRSLGSSAAPPDSNEGSAMGNKRN